MAVMRGCWVVAVGGALINKEASGFKTSRRLLLIRLAIAGLRHD